MSAAPPVERARELARESRFLTLCRVGFFARGAMYILIAALVLQSGRTEDLAGVLDYLNDGLGRLMLMTIAIGLCAYGLWRLADAWFGLESGGNDGKAKRMRLAAAGAGLAYLYLAFEAARILFAGRTGETSAQEHAAMVLDLPGGTLVLGAIALALLAGGLGQLWIARTCTFLEPLDRRALSPMIRWLGRIGYAARGIIIMAMGALLGAAAIDGRSSEAGGFEQALDLLADPVLYAVAAGLLLLGIFSVVEALYRRIPEPPPVDEIKREVVEKLS